MPTRLEHPRRLPLRVQTRVLMFGAAMTTALGAAVSCSLITPLDFVGGVGGSTSAGGESSTGGAINSGRSGESNFGGGSSSVGIAGGAGIAASAGNAGGANDATSAGNAGNAGNAGSAGCPSNAGSTNRPNAGNAGVAGSAGSATCTANLGSDPAHCGACDNACKSDQICMDGLCKSAPCEGLCANPETVIESSEGFRADQLKQDEHCLAIAPYLPTQTEARIVCWNFDAKRTLRVNGEAVPCRSGDGYKLLTPQRDGWYCVQVGAGAYDYAGILLPLR
jgi:hypothetical protein